MLFFNPERKVLKQSRNVLIFKHGLECEDETVYFVSI
jgi:hypothetical protein